MTPALNLYLSGGRTDMDRITESLLSEFSSEHGILSLPEDQRFEHFAAYLSVRRQNNETFDTSEIVTGAGEDTGIDAIAIIVNEFLVNDVEAFNELADNSASLDVTFVFVQAERSAGFDGGKILRFGSGVVDYFKDQPRLNRNEKVQAAGELMSAIFKRGAKFKRGNPICRLYYVTTGKWVGDHDLEVRRESVIEELTTTGLFRKVEFLPVDASDLQRLYRQTKNAIAREFTFLNRTVVPEIPGVEQAYLGFIPAPEFLKLLTSDSGEIVGSLFDDNVRDFLDYITVNDAIRLTLESDARKRFVLMNNGVTIIAKQIRPTGNKFVIEDYSIVNGCQTSHVLFEHSLTYDVDESVMVPIRLIGTKDDAVINDIIKATNRQTAVKEEQFYALEEFSKELEVYFQTFPEAHKLYYERRTQQYERSPVAKTKIITPANMIRAFAAMFLDEPHSTTRNYGRLKAKVGSEIFKKGHRMEPYYTAAYALYLVEYFFRNNKLGASYKPARFHILLAMRLMTKGAERIPRLNSREMEKYCTPIMEVLWNPEQSEALITDAAEVIRIVAKDDFNRDNIRTEPFTKKVLDTFSSAFSS
jgi:hypothetical protein